MRVCSFIQLRTAAEMNFIKKKKKKKIERKKSNPPNFSISFIFPGYISYGRKRANIREGEKNKTTIKENVSINKKKSREKGKHPRHLHSHFPLFFHGTLTLNNSQSNFFQTGNLLYRPSFECSARSEVTKGSCVSVGGERFRVCSDLLFNIKG